MKVTPTILFLLSVCFLNAQDNNPPATTMPRPGIKWMTIEEAEAAQKTNPKKILLHVYARWCRWCKLQDSLTYHNPEIAAYINDNYYPVKFNAESKEPVTYKGVRYEYIQDDNHLAHDFARYILNGKLSYPALLFISENGQVLNIRNGYQQAYFLEPVLHFYATNAYKEASYTDYESDFEGKIEAPE